MGFTERQENKQVSPGTYKAERLVNLDCSGDITIDALYVDNVRAKGTLTVVVRAFAQIKNIQAEQNIIYKIMPNVQLIATNQKAGGQFINRSPTQLTMDISKEPEGKNYTVVYNTAT